MIIKTRFADILAENNLLLQQKLYFSAVYVYNFSYLIPKRSVLYDREITDWVRTGMTVRGGAKAECQRMCLILFIKKAFLFGKIPFG